MQQRRVIRKVYASLSDSELISVWATGKERADGAMMAEAETELVRRGDRSYEPEIRFRSPRESIARKTGSN